MDYQFELVGKIGSMALIRREDKDIDYNIFSRLGSELKPGMIWVTSGATAVNCPAIPFRIRRTMPLRARAS